MIQQYRFYIYRDSLMPGPDLEPEVRVISVEDPKKWAEDHCKGCIDRIDWDEADALQER